jgi:uncharacterized protein
MSAPDPRIEQFIAEHHVLTLATEAGGQPYCASCFYVYLPEQQVFVFTSDTDTRHGREALANDKVAASIVLETRTVGKIQGLQLTGKLSLSNDDFMEPARVAYLKAFPFAVLKPASLWKLHVQHFKLTDNRLGFGKKIIWDREL